MATALLAPLGYAIWTKRAKCFNPYTITVSLLIGGLLTPFAVALHTRIY